MRAQMDWRLRSAAIDDEIAAAADDFGRSLGELGLTGAAGEQFDMAARTRAHAQLLRAEHEREHPPGAVTWRAR